MDSRVTIQGLENTIMQLRALALRTQNTKPFLDGPADRIVSKFFQKQFKTKGREGGTPWKRLTRATYRIRRKTARGGIGYHSGRLKASLEKSQGPDSIKIVTRNTLKRGTSVPYARFFSEGHKQSFIFGNLRRKDRQVPARPLAPDTLPTSYERELTTALARWLDARRKP